MRGKDEFQKCFNSILFLLFFFDKYDEIFDGVILAYETDIPRKRAKILSGLSLYFGVK